MKCFIVNDVDKPYPRLVAYETHEGKLNYFDRTLKGYDVLPKDRATPIEQFGFVVTVGQNVVFFEKSYEETAEYRDGRPRKWQGDDRFSHPIPEDAA